MADPDIPVETRDVSPRALWYFGLAFATFVVASVFGLLVFFDLSESWLVDRARKPEPVLQISPPEDYREFLAAKRAELHDRGWVDEEAGIAELPIAEAMRLVSQGHRARVEIDVEGCIGAACPAATPTARTIP